MIETFNSIASHLDAFFESANSCLQSINDVVWGWPMLILLLGTHLYMTVRLRFPQRYTFKAVRLSLKSDREASGDVSPFAALVTSLAGTIGTGNIVGVASAIAIGGPGALVWCLLTGLLGIATKYAESLLSLKYRVRKKNGSIVGGPMFVLRNVLNFKVLAIVFSIFTLLMGFCGGNFIQSNAIAETLNNTYGFDIYIIGVLLTIAVCAVIFFGIKGISRVCEGLVPLMALIYIVGCVILLYINRGYISPALSLIWSSAFEPVAIGGGFVGGFMIAIQYGVSRGLLSNESGMGSAPIVAAAARSRNPVRLALVSSTSTFWDTVVVCTITGLVAVSSMLALGYNWGSSDDALIMQYAFEQIPYIGSHLLIVIIFTFAFSTILGWTYCGEKAIEFMVGENKKAILAFRIFWVAATFIGAIMPLKLVWNLSSTAVVFMIIPNVIPLFILIKTIVSETRYYLWEKRLDETCEEELPEL